MDQVFRIHSYNVKLESLRGICHHFGIDLSKMQKNENHHHNIKGESKKSITGWIFKKLLFK
jgi:hypothetical protein